MSEREAVTMPSCHGQLELDLDAGRFVFMFEKERDFAKVLEAGRAGETS